MSVHVSGWGTGCWAGQLMARMWRAALQGGGREDKPCADVLQLSPWDRWTANKVRGKQPLGVRKCVLCAGVSSGLAGLHRLL